MNIATIIGARPQFIKAAMLSREILDNNKINETIIHTGQHFDKNMSAIFFEEMKIPKPHYNLEIGSLSHGAMTGRQLEKIEKILFDVKPDIVVVYGDTNSTLAGAIAASKMHIPVAHIEAGLRSFNKKMPEEINRILSDHVSDYLFTPTNVAKKNLTNEGIANEKIFTVGDIMYDAALFFGEIADNRKSIMNNLNLKHKEYILSTIHRPENTNSRDKMNNILSALSQSHLPVILPIHPGTKKKLKDYSLLDYENIDFIDPVGYLDMITLQKNANKIATDSGGIQKEAYFHRVPCITMRDETEWVELLEVGANELTGSNIDKINKALKKDFSFSEKNIYGDGTAASKIIKVLMK